MAAADSEEVWGEAGGEENGGMGVRGGGGRRGAESGGGDQVEGAQDLAEFAETDGEEELHEGGGRGPRRRRSLGWGVSERL